MIFALRIPESRFEDFKHSFEKINKKLCKSGGAPASIKITGYQDTPFANGISTAIFRTILIDVFLPDVWMQDWKFVGRIKQADTETHSNIFISANGETIPESFRKAAGECDHCRYKRKRKDTFVIQNRNDASRMMQVGSTCLGDFFGGENVRHILSSFDFIESINSGELENQFKVNVNTTINVVQQATRVQLKYYLALVASCIRRIGWVSRKSAYVDDRPATADVAWGQLFAIAEGRTVDIIEDQDRALVEEVVGWIRALPESARISEYHRNLFAICSEDTIGWQDRGIAASVIIAYRNSVPKKPEILQKSSHIGNIGERIDVEVRIDRIVKTLWGFMYIGHDSNHNCVVWYGKDSRAEQREGVVVKVRGTVKQHGNYKNVAQTILNRSSIIEVFSNVPA